MDLLEISIIKNVYNFYRELHLAVREFPKSERHALGEKFEVTALELLECLLDAGALPKSEKSQRLFRASTKLNILRVFIRLGKDIRAFDEKKYLGFQADLDEIGRMLGGWRRSVA
jgi:hypothetical protein